MPVKVLLVSKIKGESNFFRIVTASLSNLSEGGGLGFSFFSRTLTNLRRLEDKPFMDGSVLLSFVTARSSPERSTSIASLTLAKNSSRFSKGCSEKSVLDH